MRKWIIIEDEVDKAEYAIKTLTEKGEKFCWVYANNKDINRVLYPNIKPDVEIKSDDDLNKLQDVFNNCEDIVLLLDIGLNGIVQNQDHFKTYSKYLEILSEITRKKNYYLGIYSTKVSPYVIKDALKSHKIDSDKIYFKEDFTESQETVNFCIQEIINKWNSLYESLTIKDFITEYDKIVNAKGNKPNFHIENEEFTHGRDLIKRLIRLDDNNFNKICPSENNIFSDFLKGIIEKKGISLFGIYLIAWSVYVKKFNNHDLFLNKFKYIIGNDDFSRYKMFITWENDDINKSVYLEQINAVFEKLYSCDKANPSSNCNNKVNGCVTNQPVLKDIQIDTNLLTLSFDLCIDGKGFAEKFDEKVNSLFKKEYNTKENESSEKILMVMKNTWGKNSGISFETIKKNNYLKIKFYIV